MQLSRGLQMDSSEEIAKMPTGVRGPICSVYLWIQWGKTLSSQSEGSLHQLQDDERVRAGTHS